MYPTRSRSVTRPLLDDEPRTDPAYSPRPLWSTNVLADQSPAPPLDPPRLMEWIAGSKAALPLALGIVPMMLIYGVLARAAGLSPVEAQAMTLLVFSGAQLVAAQMLVGGTPAAMIVAAGVTMNVRHTLYSAALAPYLKRLSLGWRLLLAYLLTDETFALSISRYQQRGSRRYQHWFLLGSGVIIWLAAQGATLLGMLLGGQVPASWELGYTATLTFLGLLILSLKNRAGFSAALCAGFTALLTVSLPLNSGFLAAIGLGTVAGLLVDRLAGPGTEGHS
jgi:predicted branched-subunit amino acid permease